MASEDFGAELSKRKNDDENSVSMIDVLEEERQLEDDANAVLGDSDDKNCTYLMGYVTRQALYACLTCTPPQLESAGVCLACSLDCHDGHELCELYTKRNFRCDCGNSRFPDMNCKLHPIKIAKNENNKYNQNFKGLYCTCSRPYPDPEDDTDDEMIQCIICEDWYHGRHLGETSPPSNQDFQEMVCHKCMQNHEFLAYYAVQNTETKLVKAETSEKVNIEDSDEIKASGSTTEVIEESTETAGSHTQLPTSSKNEKSSDSTSNLSISTDQEKTETPKTESQSSGLDEEIQSKGTSEVCTSSPDVSDKNLHTKSDEHVNGNAKKEPCNTQADPHSSKPQQSSCEENPRTTGSTAAGATEESITCKLKELKTRQLGAIKGAAFYSEGWRQKLCTCPECKEMYEEKELSFLLETADTVTAYEDRGKAKLSTSSQYDKGMQVLSNMDRVQQVEVIHQYNDLKTELKDYLKKFADNGKVVREEDIREFFTQMEARKKQRVTEPIPYHCR